jgi:tetratricopeptide (TPR) repeat protein
MTAMKPAGTVSAEIEAEIYAEALRLQPLSGKYRIRLVQALERLGRPRDALATLNAGLTSMPDATELLSEKISLLRRTGQLDAASAEIEALAQKQPDSPKLAWLRAELASARGDHVTAAAIYAGSLAGRPLDIHCRMRLANTLNQLGQREEALATVTEGLALMPGAAELLAAQIAALLRLARLEEAAATIASFEQRHADHPKLAWLKAELASARGDHGAAAAIYAGSLRAQPRDVRCRLRLVSSLKQADRLREALAALAEGLELTPGDADMLTEQISVLQRSGQLDASAAAAAAFAQQHPNHPKLAWLKAELAAARGDHAAAAAIYAGMLRAHPQDTRCRVRLIGCLKQLDRHGEALALLADGLALTPAASDLRVEEIMVLQHSGQSDRASAALAAFAQQHPEHPTLDWIRAELASGRGDHAAAAEIHAGLLQSRPFDSRCRLRLASSLRQLDRHDEALEILDKGLALMPGAVDLLVERVTLLERAGQLEAAAAATDDLERRHPGHPKLRRLQGELAVASGDQWAALNIFRTDLAHHPRDVQRRLRVANRLQLAGFTRDALALIGERPSSVLSERVARVHAQIQLGRWDDATAQLERWPTDTPRAAIAGIRARMQLALLKFDFADARSHAGQLMAANPGDASAALALAQSATLTFDVDTAWSALSKVPISPVGSGPARTGGRRLRHSFGQLVNECRLRPEQTTQLAKAAHLPGIEQARKAARLVRRDPGSIGAALAFLIGMARAGRLEGSFGASTTDRQIPRTLHQYWDRELPIDIEKLMNDTTALNPHHVYRRWNDASARRFLQAHAEPAVLRAYREARHVAIRADIFRLAVLHAEGGVYLDADDRCTQPIETLLPATARAVFYQENTGSIGNNFLAAAPGHPLIAAALDQAVEAVLGGAGESAWLATGPGLLSRVVAGALARDRALRVPADMHVVPLWVFRGTVQACRSAGYKRSAKHWPRAA